MHRINPVLIASAVSGLLLAAAFPRPDLFPIAWCALIPLLLVMQRRPFASGFTAGIVFFAIVLYWLNIVMTTYGGLQPVFSLLAYLFLVVYLAAYFGVATWLACRLREIFKLPYLMTMPVLWVALEYLRGFLLTGFPWALLGYSQQNFSAAIQSADVTGVYGVSFLLIAVNCAFAWVISASKSRLAWLGVAAVLSMTTTHVGYGLWRNSQPLEQREDHLRVSLVQGNIEQAQKWIPENRQTSIDIYRQLSEQAAQQSSDLLIWPEAATPFFFQDESDLAQQVREIPVELNTPLLLGSPAYRSSVEAKYKYFNSAFLLSSNGLELGRSDKIHLVPFGEYVPLGNLLSFINKLVVGVGDFSPGHVNPLPLNGDKIGVLICYEAIFPQLSRDYVRNGSRLLVNLTNDAWFGNSSAPYQHLAMARFRAIENRIWLARAANTGISALISPSGRISQAGQIFQPLQISGTVGLGAEATFYTRFGDVFAYGCLGLSGVFLALILIKRKVSE
ncbi:MAG: apolipoprotein N-acyltransferase [Deltaproteobacteria bacterium]|nr:apolipoprotein N-acyltransferase [Deltaproteobacteria bacterium]